MHKASAFSVRKEIMNYKEYVVFLKKLYKQHL